MTNLHGSLRNTTVEDRAEWECANLPGAIVRVDPERLRNAMAAQARELEESHERWHSRRWCDFWTYVGQLPPIPKLPWWKVAP